MIKKEKKILRIFISIIICCSDFGVRNKSQISASAMKPFTKEIIYYDGFDNTKTLDTADQIKDIESKISYHLNDSDISRINAAKASEPIIITEETFNLLEKAIRMSERSSSIFNPAILPLIELWDFYYKDSKTPSQEEIEKTLAYCDIRNIVLDKSSHTIKKICDETKLTFDEIFMGIACDVAVKNYASKNIRSAMISINNNLGIYGKAIDDEFWCVGVINPFVDYKSKITCVNILLKDGFVSTKRIKDKPYILSPTHGCPIKTNIVSVTICCKDGFSSDVLSSVCLILGPSKSKYLVDMMNASAMFITKDKKIIASDNLRNKIKVKDESFKIAWWIT